MADFDLRVTVTKAGVKRACDQPNLKRHPFAICKIACYQYECDACAEGL